MSTGRVELRNPTYADQREFLAAMRASQGLHRPWAYPPTTPQAYDLLMERVVDPRHEPMLACRVGTA